jgi:hypothetical protein
MFTAPAPNSCKVYCEPEALRPLRPLWLWIALFALAFGVRLVGIGWSLPNAERHYSYHPDEWLVLLASYFIINPYAGEFLPGFYNYGTLPMYLWSLWLHWLSAVGVIDRLPENATPAQIAELRAQLYLWARVLVALLGAGTAVVVGRTVAQVAGIGAGVVSALAMAFAPAFVVHSRFMTVDVPTTFFVALAFHQAVALHASPRPMRTLLWGAFWAGCAAGSKYNAGLSLLAPLVGLWLLPSLSTRSVCWGVGRRWALRGLLFWLYAQACGRTRHASGRTSGTRCAMWAGARRNLHRHRAGLAVSPEAEPQRGFRRGGANHQRGRLGVARAESGLVGRAGGVAGVLPADWRSGGALFALHLPAATNAGDGRGVEFTPLLKVPPLREGNRTQGQAPPLREGNRTQGRELGSPCLQGEPKGGGLLPALTRLLVIAALAWQLLSAASLTACMVRPDARDQAAQWARANLPEGARIGFPTVPWFYTPPLFPEIGELRWQDRLAAAQRAMRYRLIPLAPPEWNAEALQATLPEYLIISEFESRDVARIGRADYQAFMRIVEARYTLLRVFENEPPLLGRREDMPHDLLYICPKVYIYRLREN